MKTHVCPWWVGYMLASPLRRLIHNPEKILAPYCRPGMTAIDVGPGMGFFTIPMARLVGSGGRVIAMDIQEKMLRSLRKRAQRAGVGDRVHTQLCDPTRIEVLHPADFCLAFYMVHETPNPMEFLSQVRSILKPSGTFLMVEPKKHVSREEFRALVNDATAVRLKPSVKPRIRWSYAMLFEASG